ncbi:MAG: 50S ribosomal protein L17 [Spirochaetaceae bacterium]|nr:50S ribosomal protein L17 [Spirochaetaceae bacterium]
MKHKQGFNPLSRRSAHRRALHRNMVSSLFRHERITTTKQKAMEIRRTAEKLITRAKEDTVHNRRETAKWIWDQAVLNKLFTEIGPRMKDRNGGYTRVMKLGFRQGDAADLAILEIVDYSFEAKQKAKDEKGKTKKGDDSKAKSKDASAKAKKGRASVNEKNVSETSAQKTTRRYNRVKGS